MKINLYFELTKKQTNTSQTQNITRSTSGKGM